MKKNFVIFDDKELEDEEYINEEDLKLLINEEENNEVEEKIKEILKELNEAIK